MEFIDEAKKKYDEGSSDGEQSILFKLLQKDRRFATVMAFDMIFAGIDTVWIHEKFVCSNIKRLLLV